MRFAVSVGTETLAVEVIETGDGRYRVSIGDDWFDVDARVPPSGPYSLLIAGASYLADVDSDGAQVVVTIGGQTHRTRVEEARRGRRGASSAAFGAAGQRLVAPMPGKVVGVHVRPGDRVVPGAPLVVLEAMKMENEFRATVDGVITEVRVTAGQAVNTGDVLVVVGGDTS